MYLINTYAELRKLKLNKLFKHPNYNIRQVVKSRKAGFCNTSNGNINVCALISHIDFGKSFCCSACVQGKQWFWYIRIKYRIILDNK